MLRNKNKKNTPANNNFTPYTLPLKLPPPQKIVPVNIKYYTSDVN